MPTKPESITCKVCSKELTAAEINWFIAHLEQLPMVCTACYKLRKKGE